MADDYFSVPQAVFDGLTQRGVRPDVAYGALGSLMGESGSKLNTSSVNAGDGADGSDSLGFGQWNGSRARNLQSTAQAMGLGWNSGQAQVAHLFNELDGKYGSGGNYSSVLKALQNGQSVADGNSIWTRNYEVPANVNQQVALRLARGQALANGAAQGTLDLSKVGAMGDSNGPPNGRAFQALGPGALSASGLTGGDGALWDIVNQQNPQPSLGNRLAMAGAALASISSPSQGSTLASIANQNKQTQTSQADKLAKFLQLKSAMQKVNQSQDTQIGTTEDKKGLIMQKPDGTSYVQPIQGIDQYQSDKGNEPKTPQITKYSEATANAAVAAQMDDRLAKLDNELLTNPKVGDELNGLSSLRSWSKNFQGASDDMSQWQKEFSALTRGYVVALQRTLPSRMSTDKGRQMEMESILPNQAQNDPVTAHQSIVRMRQALREGFGNQISSAQNYAAGFPDAKSVGYINDSQGNRIKLDDYAAQQQKAFEDRQAAIDKAYPAFKDAHDIKAGIKKPQSFMDLFSSGN